MLDMNAMLQQGGFKAPPNPVCSMEDRRRFLACNRYRHKLLVAWVESLKVSVIWKLFKAPLSTWNRGDMSDFAKFRVVLIVIDPYQKKAANSLRKAMWLRAEVLAYYLAFTVQKAYPLIYHLFQSGKTSLLTREALAGNYSIRDDGDIRIYNNRRSSH